MCWHYCIYYCEKLYTLRVSDSALHVHIQYTARVQSRSVVFEPVAYFMCKKWLTTLPLVSMVTTKQKRQIYSEVKKILRQPCLCLSLNFMDTHRTPTVTLAEHVCRGLITLCRCCTYTCYIVTHITLQRDVQRVLLRTCDLSAYSTDK